MILRLALLCLSAMLLSGCVGFGYSDTYNYRLTVKVETPEGIKSGSAVRKVTSRDNTSQHNLIVGLSGGCSFRTKGEAVVVDLGTRGKVFAILGGSDPSNEAARLVYHTFENPHGPGGQCLKPAIKYYSNLKAKADLPVYLHPTFVTFADMNDPASAKYVYGVEPIKDKRGKPLISWRERQVKEDNFAAFFGEGVKLHSITIEMTDDSVTEGIDKELPWLLEYDKKLYKGRTGQDRFTFASENKFITSLNMGSFAVGTISEPVLKKMFAPPKSHVQQP
ncbi:MAG: hypothetical protein FJX23_00075 [Alphaproteobacteria bacterium]|nr:hypothetical protein [Alphaproteobacteria bacterium]